MDLEAALALSLGFGAHWDSRFGGHDFGFSIQLNIVFYRACFPLLRIS